MTKCILLLICAVLSISFSNAQKDPPASDVDSNNVTVKKSELEQILKIIKQAKVEERQYIGMIELNANKPILLRPCGNGQQALKGKAVEIEKAIVQVKDGYIVDLEIYTTDGAIYTNTKSPISVSKKRFLANDNLRTNSKDSECIRLGDVLRLTDWRFNYYPDDGVIYLDANKKSDSLFRNVGVNTVMDLRLYTDALALFGKEPNGLAQTEIRMKQFFHRVNMKNRGFFLVQYAKVNVNAAKFDSRNNYVSSAAFSRTQLLQRSWMNAEVAVNIYNRWVEFKSASTFYWDIGAGIHAANRANATDTVSVTGQNVFSEMGFVLKSSNNVGLELAARAFVNYSPETADLGDADAKWFLRFSAQGYWNPMNDQAGRIFGRVNYSMATKPSEKKNHFFQFQLGYSILLSKALNKS